eukprot:m.158785 g.158785  ORF g.158785 m.158785 type:complete len:184 (-) comp17981_c1_seq1:1031-1582(-)
MMSRRRCCVQQHLPSWIPFAMCLLGNNLHVHEAADASTTPEISPATTAHTTTSLPTTQPTLNPSQSVTTKFPVRAPTASTKCNSNCGDDAGIAIGVLIGFGILGLAWMYFRNRPDGPERPYVLAKTGPSKDERLSDTYKPIHPSGGHYTDAYDVGYHPPTVDVRATPVDEQDQAYNLASGNKP